MAKTKRTRNAATKKATVTGVPTMTVPAAISVKSTYRGPRIKPTIRGVIVENSESLTTLTSNIVPDTEEVSSIELSARSSNLPWLSQMGALYSKYKVLEMNITYEPYCATTVGGQMVMALVYDENDSDPGNLSANRILQVGGNTRNSVWAPSACVKYDASRAAYPWLYSKQNPANTTLANLSVAAWLVFSIFSSSSLTGLGRVMAHYRVELIDPVSPQLNQ